MLSLFPAYQYSEMFSDETTLLGRNDANLWVKHCPNMALSAIIWMWSGNVEVNDNLLK